MDLGGSSGFVYLYFSIFGISTRDFVYLIEKGTLTPNKLLKKKGIQIEDGDFPGDTLVEGGEMVPGRDYQEV